jgi:hypothetical protein
MFNPTEVPPTSLNDEKNNVFTIKLLDTFLKDNISGVKYELFKEGKVVEGNKQSNSLNLLRQNIKKEFSVRKKKYPDNTYMLNKLEQALDNIFDVIENLEQEEDLRYFNLGTIIKSMYEE